ncbi:class II fructose-bisphosphate aldolase, partial [Eubacteriales bacterium OttesenSCG-928-N14]|nr:class II fructose-bisphosphate aldolase [Eubacteriales bacterium OttesenSCG-928-N14]
MKHASILMFENSMNLEDYADAVKYYSEKYPQVPAALGLDHGDSIEDALLAIKAGFTGVMVDKSMLPVEENIRILKEVVDMAHAVDVSVEAGLGGTTWRDPTPEEIIAHLTKVDEFIQLVNETKVDAVAVFVGGSHGDHKDGSAVLQYELIEQLAKATSAVLVMHGSSGTGDEKLAKAVKSGLTKFNVAGDLMAGGAEGYAKQLQEDSGSDSVVAYNQAIEAGYKKRVAEYMKFLGSTNQF